MIEWYRQFRMMRTTLYILKHMEVKKMGGWMMGKGCVSLAVTVVSVTLSGVCAALVYISFVI